MMCGIYSIAVWALINIWNCINAARLFVYAGQAFRSSAVGIIGLVVVIIVYLPEIVFFFFVVKYATGSDSIESRRGIVIGMRCLVANAFLCALAIIIFGGILAGGVGIALFFVIWLPLVILGLFLTWWMQTSKDWYHELVKVENNGQIPADKRL